MDSPQYRIISYSDNTNSHQFLEKNWWLFCSKWLYQKINVRLTNPDFLRFIANCKRCDVIASPGSKVDRPAEVIACCN